MSDSYVYSKLSAHVIYNAHSIPRSAGFKAAEDGSTDKIFINGRAGVAHRTKSGGLFTPQGAVTRVTEKQLEALKLNPVFKRHVERGFINVEDKKVEVEKGVKNLQAKDKSAPLIPKDLEKFGTHEEADPNKKK